MMTGLRRISLVALWLGLCGTRRVEGFATGSGHTCVVLDNDALKCFGANDYGQLGQGDTVSRGATPISMGNAIGAVDLGTGLTVVALSAGSGHTCAILSDSSLKCFGKNDKGQLGLGDTNNRGDEPLEMGDALPAVNLGVGRTAVSVMASGDFTCVILDTLKVTCWGAGEYGNLGLGSTEDLGTFANPLGPSLSVVDLGVGYEAFSLGAGPCAVFSTGGIKCWGKGVYGAHGLGDMDDRGDEAGEMGENLPFVVTGPGGLTTFISGGRDFNCVILMLGGVKCWGRGENGQLGNGGVATIGDDWGEMAANLPELDLALGTDSVSSLATGSQHACALLSSGGVKCWGRNFYGNLGTGDFRSKGYAPGTMGTSLVPVDFGTGRTAMSITTGDNHSCAILDDGSLKCFGANGIGQLGLGDTEDRGDDADEMGDSLPAVNLGTGRTAVVLSVSTFPTQGPTPRVTPIPTPSPTLDSTALSTPSPTLAATIATPAPVTANRGLGTPAPSGQGTPAPSANLLASGGGGDSSGLSSGTEEILVWVAAPVGAIILMSAVVILARKRRASSIAAKPGGEETKVEEA